MTGKPDSNAQEGTALVVGALVIWHPHKLLGVIEAIENRHATVKLDDGRTIPFLTDAGVLARVIEVGSRVVRANKPDNPGVITRAISGQQQPTWQVTFPNSTEMILESGLRPALNKDPLERLLDGHIGHPTNFNLKSVAADLWTQHLHNDLVSLAYARVDLKPYQVGVAHRVITEYPHRFLLCDEVGLGKTIEAGMIVKELRARQEVKRILILVPSGIQRQWQFELKTKFNEAFAIYNRHTVAYLENQGIEHPWSHHDLIITSHTWASRDNIRRQITLMNWDMIIVDEAHHARRQRYGNTIRLTKLYRLVESLIAGPEHIRRPVLLLTATPMQLQHHELYSLIEMLNPTLFSSEDDFISHVRSRSGISKLTENLETNSSFSSNEIQSTAQKVAHHLELPVDKATELVQNDRPKIIDQLKAKHRLSEVLIRNRRKRVGNFQPRSAFRWPVTPTQLERNIHLELNNLIQEGFDFALNISNSNSRQALGFLLTTFKKLAASSSAALLKSLIKQRDKMGLHNNDQTDFDIEEAEEALESDINSAQVMAELLHPYLNRKNTVINELINHLSCIKRDSKAAVLINQLNKLFQDEWNTKVIIFTQFRETQEMLRKLLADQNWGVHIFNGRLNPLQKDKSVESFRLATGPQILISTEAGGEGRNFQFCSYIVNYDLPWNPMKVEQRIGRVDRIGQNHPVVVFNLFVEDTIEERVLDVLEHRIQLFTEAVGGLEPILGKIESNIRKSIRFAGERRDRYLENIAQKTEDQVEEVRRAEQKISDFILDNKSYGTNILRTARGIDEIVSSQDYERFLLKLLKFANTYIKQTREMGVYEIMFHPPLTMSIPELIANQDRRLVCFDPRHKVDSEGVEYLGFGHPIIDYLTHLLIEEDLDGLATIRQKEGFDSTGWQFNWLVTIGSLRPRTFVHPTFVSDDGTIDRDLGYQLLNSSRIGLVSDIVNHDINNGDLNKAHDIALSDVGALVYEQSLEAQREMTNRGDEERSRIEALFKRRTRASNDKLEQVRLTLQRLERSESSKDQAVVPMWRRNLEIAQAERNQVDQDRIDMLKDLDQRLHSYTGFELLNIARIL